MARKEEILTSAGARRYLKIGRTKLWQLTKEQVIPCYRRKLARSVTSAPTPEVAGEASLFREPMAGKEAATGIECERKG
jgi:hypothetical protein